MTQHAAKGLSVAVVGGGITGAVAAETLAKHFPTVLVFDQGRRGPGGRASHRSVDPETKQVLPDDTIRTTPPTFEFDHGCQFFRADTAQMKGMVQRWQDRNWVTPWQARIGNLPAPPVESTQPPVDFFGLPARKEEPVYVGVGGMHQVPRQILANCDVDVARGTRVTNVKRNDETGQWDVWGISGTPAYHDTAQTANKDTDGSSILATVDAVLLTDISSASDSWHRASAGIPDALRRQVPQRPRVALFSCMVALPQTLELPYDAFTSTQGPLWFAARSTTNCWTLISTAQYACEQIRATTMRDPETGAFRPQENSYLNTVPGPDLLQAFRDAVRAYTNVEEPLYLQAQRWGSGMPAPYKADQKIEEICGSVYTSDLPHSVVYPRLQREDGDDSPDLDFVKDDDLKLYYAGDFCSQRSPGFEASALSGLDVAEYMVETLATDL